MHSAAGWRKRRGGCLIAPDSVPVLADAARHVAERLPVRTAGAAVTARLRDACESGTAPTLRAAGELLLRLGFVTQAKTLFDALAEADPAQPAGPASLVQVAIRRKAWPLALRRLDALIAAFPRQPNAYWPAARARILGMLDRADEADSSVARVIEQHGTQPFGYIARAQIAEQRGLPAQALELWDDVLARFPDHGGISFAKVARASLLGRLHRHAEAETSFRESIHADPLMLTALLALMVLLHRMERYEDALREWDSSIFADAMPPEAVTLRLRLLIWLQRFDDAKALFRDACRDVLGLETIQYLMEFPPRLYQGAERTEIQAMLLDRLDALPGPVGEEEATPFYIIRARLALTLGDHPGFLTAARQVEDWHDDRRLYRDLRHVAAVLTEPRFPDFDKPKIFGVGLSKTGTSSLASALNTFGIATLHWTNLLTGAVISDADLPLFDGFTDTPVCMAFERYFEMFPNSKFIYTTRPIRSWSASFVSHWRRVWRCGDLDALTDAVRRKAPFAYGDYFREIHFNLYFKYENIEQAYWAYDRRVREFFADKPKNRMLEFNIFEGDGWPQLCAFLGTDIPPIPFPCENARPDLDI